MSQAARSLDSSIMTALWVLGAVMPLYHRPDLRDMPQLPHPMGVSLYLPHWGPTAASFHSFATWSRSQGVGNFIGGEVKQEVTVTQVAEVHVHVY
jgi:hypothetical protein